MNESIKLIVELQCSINELRQKNTDLQKELDDLKAHNEQLQSLLSVKELCVNKIKADAVRGSKGQCESEWCSDIGDFVIFGESIDEYANQLEQGDTE